MAAGVPPVVTGPDAPALDRADDPWAWHEVPGALPALGMRRRRRIDVVPAPDDATVLVDAPLPRQPHGRRGYGNHRPRVRHRPGPRRPRPPGGRLERNPTGAAVVRMPRGRGQRRAARGPPARRVAGQRARRVPGHQHLHPPQRRLARASRTFLPWCATCERAIRRRLRAPVSRHRCGSPVRPAGPPASRWTPATASCSPGAPVTW